MSSLWDAAYKKTGEMANNDNLDKLLPFMKENSTIRPYHLAQTNQFLCTEAQCISVWPSYVVFRWFGPFYFNKDLI